MICRGFSGLTRCCVVCRRVLRRCAGLVESCSPREHRRQPALIHGPNDRISGSICRLRSVPVSCARTEVKGGRRDDRNRTNPMICGLLAFRPPPSLVEDVCRAIRVLLWPMQHRSRRRRYIRSRAGVRASRHLTFHRRRVGYRFCPPIGVASANILVSIIRDR